jgi:hypothetical protein
VLPARPYLEEVTVLAITAGYRLNDLPERLALRIVVGSGHWIWTTSTGLANPNGYGFVSIDGKKQLAHRVIYRLLIGDPGPELDHLCQITVCVYPGCLEPVTHAENQRRLGLALTHCRKAGHLRTIANTYRDPTTGRARCRPCMQDAERKRPARGRRTA